MWRGPESLPDERCKHGTNATQDRDSGLAEEHAKPLNTTTYASLAQLVRAADLESRGIPLRRAARSCNRLQANFFRNRRTAGGCTGLQGVASRIRHKLAQAQAPRRAGRRRSPPSVEFALCVSGFLGVAFGDTSPRGVRPGKAPRNGAEGVVGSRKGLVPLG